MVLAPNQYRFRCIPNRSRRRVTSKLKSEKDRPVPRPCGSAASPTLSSSIKGSALVLLETLQTRRNCLKHSVEKNNNSSVYLWIHTYVRIWISFLEILKCNLNSLFGAFPLYAILLKNTSSSLSLSKSAAMTVRMGDGEAKPPFAISCPQKTYRFCLKNFS